MSFTSMCTRIESRKYSQMEYIQGNLYNILLISASCAWDHVSQRAE